MPPDPTPAVPGTPPAPAPDTPPAPDPLAATPPVPPVAPAPGTPAPATPPIVAQPPAQAPESAPPANDPDWLKQRLERQARTAEERTRKELWATVGAKSQAEYDAAIKRFNDAQAAAETARVATLTREQQLGEEVARARAEAAATKQQLADLQEAEKHRQVEAELTAEATSLGFVDPTDAIALLRVHVADLSDAEAEALDTKAWLGELKTKKPHLVKAAPAAPPIVPANTAPGAPAPAPAPANPNAPFDARTLPGPEWQKHLRSLGVPGH